MKRIENERFGEERALYGSRDLHVLDCRFSGEEDGESAFKESVGVVAERCLFDLRYPFWHNDRLRVIEGRMSETCRAPFWYCNGVLLENCVMHGTKAVRECSGVRVEGSTVVSDEFGWKCDGVELVDTEIESAYLFLDSKNISLRNVKMKGKYSFQYVDGLTIEDSFLDTKDAFWHAKNVTVKNSVVKGEYLGWFSEGLTLINCKIIGTQPLCYCKALSLVDCEMEGSDLSFEYSEVEATVRGHIDSVKNPKSGTVRADSVGEIIYGDAVTECGGLVFIK